MCNRYVLASGINTIENELLAKFDSAYTPFYNAYPGGIWPVILAESPERISHAKWGLIPYWSKWYSGNYNYNAFITEIAKHPAYRTPIARRRCLIPANGYYLWAKAQQQKQPYAVYIKEQKVFTLAGLYDIWKDWRTNTYSYSFAIISTLSCKRLAKLTPVMPAIIPRSHRSKYLGNDIHLNEIMKILKPFESGQISFFPVSKLINDPLQNDKRVIQPVGERI